MMNQNDLMKQLWNTIRSKFYGVEGLLAGWFLLLLLSMTFDDYFKKIINELLLDPTIPMGTQTVLVMGNPVYLQTFIRQILLAIYGSLYLGYLVIWKRNQSYLPKNRDKIGIILAIKTENKKQRKYLEDDFKGRLEDILRDNGLIDSIKVEIISEHQTKVITNTLDQNYSKLGQFLRGELGQKEIEKSNGWKEWGKIQKKVNGHFWVWGTIKERGNTKAEEKFILSINAFVVHNPLELNVHKTFLHDFNSVWTPTIKFDKNLGELNGFESTAENIILIIEYICGIAAHLSGDVPTAFKLHEKLLLSRNQIEKFFPNQYQILINKTMSWAEVEAVWIARNYYYANDLVNFDKYVQKILLINPKSYNGYMLKAIYGRETEQPYETIISLIHEAKRLNSKDNGWRYSEAFIMLLFDRIALAQKKYSKLCRRMKQKGEAVLLDQICYDIDNYLRIHPDKYQMHYAIGLIQHRRNQNPPDAFYHFENFLFEANGVVKYNLLIDESEKYLKEISKRLEIEL